MSFVFTRLCHDINVQMNHVLQFYRGHEEQLYYYAHKGKVYFLVFKLQSKRERGIVLKV